VGLAHVAFQVAGELVAAGGGATRDQQFQRQRPTHVIGYTDDHRVLATHRTIGVAKQGHHALGRARAQAEAAQREAAHVHRLEAIHVLAGVDAVDQRVLVDVLRQRRLHQDAVDGRIGVELVDQREQFFLRRAARQVVVEGSEADLVAGLALVAHVHRRGGVVAHQHHSEARRGMALRLALGDASANPLQQFLRDAFAVENACAHVDTGAKDATLSKLQPQRTNAKLWPKQRPTLRLHSPTVAWCCGHGATRMSPNCMPPCRNRSPAWAAGCRGVAPTTTWTGPGRGRGIATKPGGPARNSRSPCATRLAASFWVAAGSTRSIRCIAVPTSATGYVPRAMARALPPRPRGWWRVSVSPSWA